VVPPPRIDHSVLDAVIRRLDTRLHHEPLPYRARVRLAACLTLARTAQGYAADPAEADLVAWLLAKAERQEALWPPAAQN
jgi:hypothetical protein